VIVNHVVTMKMGRDYVIKHCVKCETTDQITWKKSVIASLTLAEELKSLIYGTLFCNITYTTYKLLKSVEVLWPIMYVLHVCAVCISIENK